MKDWKFNHIDFSVYPYYEGDDLGVFRTPEKTMVKIWAPSARMVEFRLYKDGKTGSPFYKTQLQMVGNGVWSTVLSGDYEGRYYTFRVNDGEWLNEVPDMYARCVGVNGKRGMIFNAQKTNPEGWEEDKGPSLNHYCDAVIYETHVRDFSIALSSGIENKGKYLGFTEFNTRSPKGLTTGLSHLKELGISHVHFLPVNDFFTVDEEKPFEKYNWGYDPQHFNAPEGSYATDPYDGTIRIKELKMAIQSLHKAGIGVILDVVYNHTYLTKSSVFNQLVPGYFYRQKPDGHFADASGCGNEVATERAMVGKFIVDSLKYWVREFHIDGFRFDLMGIYDLETMRIIRQEMDKLKPGILLYGEGWAAGPSPMPQEKRAVKQNLAHLPGIAGFNDDFRDAIKGNHGNKKNKGFVSGLGLREEGVKFGIVGAVHHPQVVYDYVETTKNAWAADPGQTINYAGCHDNYTLWDKLKASALRAGDEELRKMVKLAGALVLTSQGVPFLHAGIDFCRTKGGHPNSYKSPDSVNQIDWTRKETYSDVFEYFKNLIALRKRHPAFRMTTGHQVKEHIHFCTEYKIGTIGYCIDGSSVGDIWGKIVLIFNANRENVLITLPEGRFRVMVKDDIFSEGDEGEVVSGNLDAEALAMTLLVKIDS